MRIYVCFDDTDTLDCGRGTGKFARWFGDKAPEGLRCWGVVRQQLLFDPRVPFTSHNSSACVVFDTDRAVDPEDLAGLLETLQDMGAAHIAEHFVEGSDPGLCVAADDGLSKLDLLVEFGRRAAVELVTRDEAREVARDAGVHLSGHGGTEDGVIGALAGVGLTHWGWSGRFIDYKGGLRDFDDIVTVADLEAADMLVVPIDRNVISPKPGDLVDTGSWVRPRLIGGRAIMPVQYESEGRWAHVVRRMPKQQNAEE